MCHPPPQLVRYIIERRAAPSESFSVDAVLPYTEVASGGRSKDSGGVSSSELSFTEKVLYVPSIDAVVTSVARSPVAKVFDAGSLRPLGSLSGGSKGQRGSIEAMATIEDGGSLLARSDGKVSSYLVTSTSDSTLALWAMDPGPRQFSMIHRFSTPYSQVGLARWVNVWNCVVVVFGTHACHV